MNLGGFGVSGDMPHTNIKLPAAREAPGNGPNMDLSQQAARVATPQRLQVAKLFIPQRNAGSGLCRVAIQAVARRLLNLKSLLRAP